MRHILDVCKQYDIYVMVDETYVEFADNMAELTAVPLTNYYNNIVILRGTSKFFAAPGIRLGYGVSSNQTFLDRFKTNTNPWSVNSLADFIGQHIFTDFEFHKKTQTLVSEERRKELVKVAGKYAEQNKIAIRNIRRDALDEVKKLKKDNLISEDDEKRYGTEIQKLTDDSIKKSMTCWIKKKKIFYKSK